MSNLFRKDALEHRSRALYGEVVLKAPLGSWVITALLILLMAVLIAGLFFLYIPVEDGTHKVRLVEWLRAGGQ